MNSLPTLTFLTEGIWLVHRDLRFLGVETGTRMTIVRLSDGGLFVHSPIALSDALRGEVDALGAVKAIVAPSLFHHMFVGEWIEAYPDAVVYCCPGLEAKRKDLAWTGILSNEPESAWRGDLEQVWFGARSLENEVIFYHGASRTLICSDFIFNLHDHRSWLTRLVATFIGNRKPGSTWLERILIRDKRRAKEELERIIAWDVEAIVLAHGALIPSGGNEIVAKAYHWLL